MTFSRATGRYVARATQMGAGNETATANWVVESASGQIGPRRMLPIIFASQGQGQSRLAAWVKRRSL